MPARPFAVFDIDGTIIRWQLYHAITDELGRQGHLDPKRYEKVRAARMTWKQRTHEASYQDYERALIDLYESAVKDIEVDTLKKACGKVLDTYKDQVYRYTRDLIKDLKRKDYFLFAISASQDMIVSLLAMYYGFDDAGGSSYEVKNGRFTGKSEILRSERKPEFLKQLVEKHGASWQGSIAVGDSEGDIAMLAAVEQPIAFNPTKELFDYAQSQGWPIVVERKNVIYKLESQDGSYVLAETSTR
jgi:HAD superfamily hydrolase (TIGR01490 family)